MITKKCENCFKEITVRSADVKRGWGKFCSKSCKAKHQTRTKGYKKSYRQREYFDDYEDVGHPFADGYFGHGQS